jgi:hypothetical protein
MMNSVKLISILTLFFAMTSINLFSCTNFIVTAGASTDGSVMITYNADAGGFMEPFYYMPAADHEPGTMVDIYEWDTGKCLGQIAQVPHTYKVVGNINEHQVAIGETTYTGRPELQDTTAIMDYGSLMYIALQRAKTATRSHKSDDRSRRRIWVLQHRRIFFCGRCQRGMDIRDSSKRCR